MTTPIKRDYRTGYVFGVITFYKTKHKGYDYIVPRGTPVFSSMNGKVQKAYLSASYGNVVFIEEGSITTVYAHLSKISVKINEQVRAGQQIGLSGNTGLSTGPHLHFEVRVNDKPVDPEPWLKEQPHNQEELVSQEQKDFEKTYVLFEAMFARRPKSDQEVRDTLAHYNGIRQAGSNEENAWHQIMLEMKQSPEYKG